MQISTFICQATFSITIFRYLILASADFRMFNIKRGTLQKSKYFIKDDLHLDILKPSPAL